MGFGLAAGLMIGVASMPVQEQKVGYVESDKILADMPEAKSVDTKLKDMGGKAQRELEKLQKDFSDALEIYTSQQPTMTADAKKKREEELKKKQQQLLELRDKKAGELQEEQAKLLMPIRNKITAAIEKVAAAQGYSMVLDKGGLATPVLYANPANNLTRDVQKQLEKGK